MPEGQTVLSDLKKKKKKKKKKNKMSSAEAFTQHAKH